MSQKFLFVCFSLTLFLGFISLYAGESSETQFIRLTSLQGEWQGITKEGKAVTLSYELVSNESALLERLKTGDEPEMITMYHRDGAHLMMIHYCSAKNQPRMRREKTPGNDNIFVFKFLDATNLANPEDGHIHGLVLTIQDMDHIKHAWTWREKGEEETNVFELERVR